MADAKNNPQSNPEKKEAQPSAPATPPHVAEQESPPIPIVKAVPHVAEKEPVTSGGFMTVQTKSGKKTVFVERSPHSGTHATVMDPDPQHTTHVDTHPHGQSDQPAEVPDQPEGQVKKGRRRARKQRARETHGRSVPPSRQTEEQSR